jgi:hypothetical protein
MAKITAEKTRPIATPIILKLELLLIMLSNVKIRN